MCHIRFELTLAEMILLEGPLKNTLPTEPCGRGPIIVSWQLVDNFIKPVRFATSHKFVFFLNEVNGEKNPTSSRYEPKTLPHSDLMLVLYHLYHNHHCHQPTSKTEDTRS